MNGLGLVYVDKGKELASFMDDLLSSYMTGSFFKVFPKRTHTNRIYIFVDLIIWVK